MEKTDDIKREPGILERNNEIKRKLDKIFGPKEQEMADLEKNINDYYFNTCLNIFAENAMRDMLVIEFNTLVDVLSKIDHDYKARLEIVDELIRLAYQIRKAGRASKEDTDKILCFYGFLHTLYSHQLYPHRITQERVDRKAMEVGKRNYQDNHFVSHCSYPFKSVDEIKKQYSESMVELKRIFNK